MPTLNFGGRDAPINLFCIVSSKRVRIEIGGAMGEGRELEHMHVFHIECGLAWMSGRGHGVGHSVSTYTKEEASVISRRLLHAIIEYDKEISGP